MNKLKLPNFVDMGLICLLFIFEQKVHVLVHYKKEYAGIIIRVIE